MWNAAAESFALILALVVFCIKNVAAEFAPADVLVTLVATDDCRSLMVFGLRCSLDNLCHLVPGLLVGLVAFVFVFVVAADTFVLAVDDLVGESGARW